MANLFKHPFLALIAFGVVALLIAATGVVPISIPPIAITSNAWRLLVAGLGSIFVLAWPIWHV